MLTRADTQEPTETPFEPQRFRSAQQAMLDALTASPKALRRDPCGDWRISGKCGAVYHDPGGTYTLYVIKRSAMAWTYAKRRLEWCAVTQDGDNEGCLRMQGLPSPSQAETMRTVLGIRKRAAYSPEHLALLRERARQFGGLSPDLAA